LTKYDIRDGEQYKLKFVLELYKNLYILSDVKNRLEWLEQVLRKDRGRTDMKIFESKLKGRKNKKRKMQKGKTKTETVGR
jgi:hypothetical protein